MRHELKTFWGLTFDIGKAGFRVRNEGSFLGVLWYLLNPLLFFALLYLLFSHNVGAGVAYYPLYLFLGLIMFNFFQNVAGEASSIIRSNRSILKSLNLPRAAFFAGNVLKFLYSHIFDFIAFMLFAAFLKANLIGIMLYPLILAFFVLFIFGASLIIGSISVYVIDFGNVWNFLSTLLWFVTPLFYTLEGHPLLAQLSYLNPLYYFITAARDIIIYHQTPSSLILAGIIAWSAAALALGLIIFNELKDKFTEVI